MKSVVIGVSIAIILLAVAAATGFYLGYFSIGQRAGSIGVNPSPSPPPTVSPFPTLPSPMLTPLITPAVTPPAITPPKTPPVPSQTVTPSITPTVPSPTIPVSNVNFQIAITDMSGTGLSRTATAQVTNTGTTDAHNVWVKSEVLSQGQRIQLSGKDYLRINIGTIKAGTTVTVQPDLSFNLLDGLKIQQNGAQLTLTIYSDEHTQTLTYDYKP